MTPAGRAIRERRVVHYADVLSNPDTPPVLRRMGQIIGYHSVAFAPMVWEDRGIGAVGVAAVARGLQRQGARAAADLRRPGGDRDPERAPVQAGAGSARRGGGGQRSEERVPRDDEPRDPHADERRDRHERAAARHQARRRAARLRRDHARVGRRAADDHQRHPRLLEDRGRADGHRVASVRPARVRRVGARPGQHARGREAPRHRLRVRGRRAGGDQRRPDAAAPGPAQPAVERGEVHRDGRGRADGAKRTARGRPRRADVLRARHRHRPFARGHGPAVPVVLAGRLDARRASTAAPASASRSASGSPS